MITEVAGHKVDLDLLRSPANIADIGCRDFAFTNFFDQRGDFVIPIDIDHLPGDRPYMRIAITNYNGVANIRRTNDPQATAISKVITGEEVACITLEKLLHDSGISYFDLIKLDVEKSEKEIIHSLKKAPAKFLSIEFHRHLGQTDLEIQAMVLHLETLGYKIASHEKTNQHGAGFNYWSSLFIR